MGHNAAQPPPTATRSIEPNHKIAELVDIKIDLDIEFKKDLDKFWVPMQLEMEKDSDCDKEWVVCCGYDAMLLRGSELDDAPRSEWTKATRPGWRMLIMPPQLPGEDDISLVAVRKIDCEKTYEEAEARRVQYQADAKV